ncbi:MAG: hypothetical protein KBB11_01835 [Bacteroidales bacterium]|nr:hypothetical protein [Bacteroidales bacterium]HOY39343.1 two-component regulator propeller domain-containing protein [Bacteroidales bacterium]HQP02987.1 two-component regulator propeller domain-containing protein [Bacteroidales bacterium]
MNTIQKYFSIIPLLIISMLAVGQVAVGQWRDHLPYNYGKMLAETDSKVFVVTNVGMYSYDKNSGEIEKLSKITGLSDAGMLSVAYDSTHDLVFIGYSNGNIDIINNNRIINVPDIKRKPLTYSKAINSILFIDDYAYLSCGFGIVVFDMVKLEIKDTYYIGDNGGFVYVNEIATDGDNLYAATVQGIYKGAFTSNLVDFSNWQVITDMYAIDRFAWVAGMSFNCLEWFGGKLIVNFDNQEEANSDTLLVFDNGSWSYLDTVVKATNSITSNGNKLVVTSDYYIRMYNEGLENYHHVWSYNFENGSLYPNYAIIGKENTLWIADRLYGLVRSRNLWTFEKKSINGPLNYVFFDMASAGNEVYGVAGGFNLSLTPTYRYSMLYRFSDQWDTRYYVNEPEMQPVTDLVSVAVNPANPTQVYAGSWTKGLLEFNNFALSNIFDETNSPIETIPGNDLIRVGGLAFDSENNLWITCSDNEMPVVVKMADGTWHTVDYSAEINALNVRQIIITQTGKKWIVLPRGGGLFVFDDHGTPADKSDDEYRKLSIVDEYGQVISNEVFSIAEDKNGAVWVGTNAGVVVYYNPDDVFDQSVFYGQQVKIPRNDGTDDADILLGAETVTAIAVDGANRKWFGTQNGGVFLTSSDGISQKYHFSTDNSPLLSNNVYCITINPSSGEVFFGTERGLISFRGEATEGDNDFTEVYSFPNPVPPGYTGTITIHGLIAGSYVKITDISGNLVTEMRSLGGQAVWDGNDINGNRVCSGVYLVFSSNEDGSKKNITKILFMN